MIGPKLAQDTHCSGATQQSLKDILESSNYFNKTEQGKFTINTQQGKIHNVWLSIGN